MPERPSLIDDAGIPEPSGGSGGGSGRGLDPKMLKMIGVGAILVAALAVLAWGMGLFDGGREVDPENEQRKQRKNTSSPILLRPQQQQQQQQRAVVALLPDPPAGARG